jgi:hypothetical protein
MIAVIIVLWFVLFPVIPLVISTLGAIVTTVAALSFVISSQVAEQANKSKGPFCFDENTKITVIDEQGIEKCIPIKDSKIGYTFKDGSKITAIITMDGMNVPLYEVEGIRVSGSHLIKGTDGLWKSVCEDERAIPTSETSAILYCLNTTSHNIPIESPISQIHTHNPILFRDWEEFAEEDSKGHYSWNYIVLKILNNYSSYSKWKDSLTVSTEVPLLSPNMKVKTTSGYIELSKLAIGITELVDKQGKLQRVLGIVKGEGGKGLDTANTWHTELFEWNNGVWTKGQSTVVGGSNSMIGQNIITETGEFVIWDDKTQTDKVIRDFTDIGHQTIHETYPLVASRLRIYE